MRWLGAVIASAVLAGCFNVKAKFIPPGVTQEIGANHLATATARWQCEGGEELGLLADQRLFVASQDFLVPFTGETGPYSKFEYERSSDGWNVIGAAMIASYLIPEDHAAPAFARYGTLYVSSFKSWTVENGDWVSYYSRETRAYAPAWADMCWPTSTPMDSASMFTWLYRGAEATTEAPRGRHLRLSRCGSNLRENGHASNSTSYARSSGLLGTGYAGSADMVFAPPDMWIDDDGSVTLGRVDGKRFRLTHPYSYGGTTGFLYERAQVPIYVNPNPGEEGIYIYRWQVEAMGDAPRALGTDFTNTDYVMACAMEAVK